MDYSYKAVGDYVSSDHVPLSSYILYTSFQAHLYVRLIALSLPSSFLRCILFHC